MKTTKKNIIKKNKTKKNIKIRGGGKVLFNDAIKFKKDIINIIEGDILIANNNKFTAVLDGTMTTDGLKYNHSQGKGFALKTNYNNTWIAVSKKDYDKLSIGNPIKKQLVIPEGYSPIVICNAYSGFNISNDDGIDYSNDRGNIELVKAVYNKGSDKFASKEIEWDNYIINFIPSIMIKKGETIKPYLNEEESKFAYYRINEYDGMEGLELFPDKYKIDKIRDLIKSANRMDPNPKIKEISDIIEMDIKIIE